MKRNIAKALTIIAVLLMIIGFAPWFRTVTKLVDTGYHGFGVDLRGRVYIGKDDCIRVYQDGALADTIQLRDYRYYWMTVEKEHIVIAGSRIETYTLQGERVSEKPDYYSDTYDAMREKHASVTVNGIKYTIQSRGFGQTIVDDGGVIHYQTPREEWIGRIGCATFSIGYWILIIMYLAKEGLFRQLWDKLRQLFDRALGLYQRIRDGETL